MGTVATLVQGAKGDEYGQVNLRFTAQGLNEFVALLNTNKLRNHRGSLLIFQVDERLPGEAIFIVTEVRDA